VHVHHVPILPELIISELPGGTHVLIMTHDHAEDAALCDAALRCGHLGSIGLIGSAAKWSRFRKRLTAEGHDAAQTAVIDRSRLLGASSAFPTGPITGADKSSATDIGMTLPPLTLSPARSAVPGVLFSICGHFDRTHPLP
jgi:hypothetical protein